MQLRVAQAVPDTEAEGPGRRFALWVQGCTLRCPGCCNPEMWQHGKGGALVEVDELAARVLSTPGIEGLSVLGGEPFEHAAPLAALCAKLQAGGLSVMVYTGFTRAELDEQVRLGREGTGALLAQVDLLVDGRYEQGKPEKQRRWIGSSNQVMHFLTNRYSPDDPRFAAPNTVELRLVNGQLLINGWPAAADALRKR